MKKIRATGILHFRNIDLNEFQKRFKEFNNRRNESYESDINQYNGKIVLTQLFIYAIKTYLLNKAYFVKYTKANASRKCFSFFCSLFCLTRVISLTPLLVETLIISVHNSILFAVLKLSQTELILSTDIEICNIQYTQRGSVYPTQAILSNCHSSSRLLQTH